MPTTQHKNQNKQRLHKKLVGKHLHLKLNPQRRPKVGKHLHLQLNPQLRPEVGQHL